MIIKTENNVKKQRTRSGFRGFWGGKTLGPQQNIGEMFFFGITYLVLILFCLSLVYLLVWMLYTSLKDKASFIRNPFSLPETPYWENYVNAFSKMKVKRVTVDGVFEYGLDTMLFNSLYRSIVGPLITVFTTTCVAYVVSCYKFKGRNFIYFLGLFVMITPIAGNLPAALRLNKALGFYDNMYLWTLKGFGTPFGMNFILMYGAFKSLSWSYAEAAQIDGCSHYGVMFKIMLPMMLPTCTVLFVLSFLTSWNDYSTPLIWLPSFPNLAYGMYIFQQNASLYRATIPEILAGFTMIAVPTSIVYALSQKLIVQRLSVGGLK